jgi:FkbM family methyltransferase
LNINLEFISDAIKSKERKSQLGQDVLAASIFGDNGFFVEFGAADAENISNTYLLEKDHGWKGILVEPNPIFHESLKSRECIVDHRCVYTKTGELISFISVDEMSELSTITDYTESDRWASNRKRGTQFEVETVSLDDLLEFHNAPSTIEYVSIDTEGSEFDILSAFSFNKDIKLFTIEHNYTDSREKIYDLMVYNGYTRILEELSAWDDWYFKE